MSVHPSIETLRNLVARDREFFKAQSQRLIEIQQSDPNTLSNVDRNALSNWDKSVVTDCNRQLLLLEEIKQPSAEERAIMNELNELITLGDHIMEKRNLVHAELNDRLNAAKKRKTAKSIPTHKEKAEPITMPPQEAFGDTDQRPRVAVTSFPAKVVLDTVSVPSAGAEIPTISQNSLSHNLEVGLVQDGINAETVNPRILYETLGVEPDASLDDIRKATRKTIMRLHPDRNPDEANAASMFADFQAACKVFESEKMRREFDDTGDVEEIDDLQARLRGLAVR